METLLLVIALFLFAGLTLNCLHLAFTKSLGWGFLCLLFPPAWLTFYGFNWRDYRVQGVAHLVSLAAFVLFSALYIRANPFIFDGHALAPVRDWVAPAFGQSPLEFSAPVFASDYDIKRVDADARYSYGRYSGKDLQFQQVVLSNGVLRFKQLETQEPVELVIDLSHYDIEQAGSLGMDVTPDSQVVPVVHVMTFQNNSAVPVVESYDRGYWLELIVDRIGTGRYEGQVKLKLPDGGKSYLAGMFSATDKDLIWEFDEVKRSYDSNDTIEYITEQYLVNNLGSSLDEVVDFNGTFFQTNLENSTGHTNVRISMVDGSTHNIAIELFKNDQGWVVERSPVRDLISALQTIQEQPPAAISSKPVLVQTRTFSADEVDELVGLNVTIVTRDGKTREGLLDSVDRYNVSLVTYLGGGEVAMMVRRREVKEVRLKD